MGPTVGITLEKAPERSEMGLKGGQRGSQGRWQDRGGRVSDRPREA